MNILPQAEAALSQVVERFKAGDLSPVVQYARLQRTGGSIPSDCWSLSNRILAFIQTGSYDCRGYRQWQQVGRYVKSGSKAAYILGPIFVPVRDAMTGEEIPVLRGFKQIAVFADHQTAGRELPPSIYSPRELPPLASVAKRLGIEVSYQSLPSSRWADCTTDGTKIRLDTIDPSVFFHELAHAAHARLKGGLKGGQDAHQETVAEFTAAVLMQMYGLGDRTGNCWKYIAQYAQDPLLAVVKALSTVEQVLALLLADNPTIARNTDTPEMW
jgi:hypothetical protein